MSHPEVEERLSHGEPTWFVRDKRAFAMFADHHHNDRVAVWCAAPEGFQVASVESAPDQFFRPPYVAAKGWVGMYLDASPDWDSVSDIVDQAYQTVSTRLSKRG
jgi:predicted DNA-binding protein (MmcQ/YjbR family)